jgi:putative membrane protein
MQIFAYLNFLSAFVKTSNQVAGRAMPKQRWQHEGTEPDYRFTLANERTFLAWIRTALALDAGGLAIEHLLPPLATPGLQVLLGAALISVGTIIGAASYLRWRGNQRALRNGDPLPPSRLPAALAAPVGIGSLIVLTLVLATALG